MNSIARIAIVSFLSLVIAFPQYAATDNPQEKRPFPQQLYDLCLNTWTCAGAVGGFTAVAGFIAFLAKRRAPHGGMRAQAGIVPVGGALLRDHNQAHGGPDFGALAPPGKSSQAAGSAAHVDPKQSIIPAEANVPQAELLIAEQERMLRAYAQALMAKRMTAAKRAPDAPLLLRARRPETTAIEQQVPKPPRLLSAEDYAKAASTSEAADPRAELARRLSLPASESDLKPQNMSLAISAYMESANAAEARALVVAEKNELQAEAYDMQLEELNNDEAVHYIDLDSLVTYDSHQQHPLAINPYLGGGLYRDIVRLASLSYELAKVHTVETHKFERVDAAAQELCDDLSGKGFETFAVIFGKTGKDNSDDDATAVITFNRELNLIVVAFHGSRNGIKIPFVPNFGDWAANFDSALVPTSEVNLDFGPEAKNVLIHRGFGNNYQSAREELFKGVVRALRSLGPNARIIFTGHSKGAAMATIATVDVKSRLHQEGIPVHVGAILVSAPKVFNLVGRFWVHKTVGKRNIIRVHAHGDIVTILPVSAYSVGVLLLDDHDDVLARAISLLGYGFAWHSLDWWISYHYACSRHGGQGFEPLIVPSFEELPRCLERALEHIRKKGVHPMTESLKRPPAPTPL